MYLQCNIVSNQISLQRKSCGHCSKPLYDCTHTAVPHCKISYHGSSRWIQFCSWWENTYSLFQSWTQSMTFIPNRSFSAFLCVSNTTSAVDSTRNLSQLYLVRHNGIFVIALRLKISFRMYVPFFQLFHARCIISISLSRDSVCNRTH